MRCARKASSHQPSRYATHADFCRIFEKDMNRLYLLSFLLTGNHALAEKCFVRGLHDSRSGNPVFIEWAQSWALRKIVQNAIEMIHPRPADNRAVNFILERNTEHPLTEPAEIAQVLALPAFERFAFVLSVLERYSDQECALLLDCTLNGFADARSRAMHQIGRSAEGYHNAITIRSDRDVAAVQDSR